ncbi:MBL fold metallo-hydrolase [soil metagenome]
MKIIPLSEGAFTVDASKQFVPFNLQTDDLQNRNKGSLLVEIQPFVVITDRDILLLDTGLGFVQSGHMQIHKNLFDHGIDPSSITKVLMSHLHKDHAGGMGNTLNDKATAAFINADYYINSKEFENAFSANGASYLTHDFEFLRNSEKLRLIDDKGSIDDYIFYERTGGHSPYHQCFKIIQNLEIVFFGGDVAPQLQQMKSRFVAKYDFDGKKSMELRKEWWEKGEVGKWCFLFYHDLKNPVVNRL